MTKIERFVNILTNTEGLTSRQIASRFRVANPRDLVYRARQQGHEIGHTMQANSKGVVMRRYTMAGRRDQARVA